MVGLLGDLLIQNKPNAKEFLKATNGMKVVYPVIAHMLTKFPLDFLVDFLITRKFLLGATFRGKNIYGDHAIKNTHTGLLTEK